MLIIPLFYFSKSKSKKKMILIRKFRIYEIIIKLKNNQVRLEKDRICLHLLTF